MTDKPKFNFNERYPPFNKKHVAGDKKYSRKKFVNYSLLGEIDPSFKQLAVSFLKNFDPNYNDIGIDSTYRMSQRSPLRTYFDERYRQVLIQRPLSDGENEDDYLDSLDAPLVDACKEYLKGIDIFRTRFAILPPDSVLDWHIDTNTSVACRVHFSLFGKCLWKIQRNGTTHEYLLDENKILFTNTGYSHRVETIENNDRIVITIGCKPTDLTSKFPSVLISSISP